MLYCSINGHQTDLLSVKNRGLSYGDGLFTTAKIADHQIEMLPQHIKRLVDGCHALQIQLPDINKLTDELQQTARLFSKAVIKVIITSGEGGRGYSRIGTSSSTVIISVTEYPSHYDIWQKKGIHLGISQLKLGINPMLLGIKHLNRLEQVLLRKELDQRDEDDLLVCNIDDVIIESSCANIFWSIDDKIYTPKITYSGVAGLMREYILSNIPNVIIDDFTLADVERVQGMFICNSVMGIVPINRFNGKLLSLEKLIHLV